MIFVKFLAVSFLVCQAAVDKEAAIEESRSFGQVKNYAAKIAAAPISNLSVAWKQEVGEGRSQIVGNGDRIYVACGFDERNDKQVAISTQIRCLDIANGDQIWEWKTSGNKHDDQENFSGAPYSPQSTPLLLKDRILAVTFDGQLACLNIENGKLIWKRDLVRDLKADPVQFGFSSSPVVDNRDANRVYVQAHGKDGGLYCINPRDGSTIWRALCRSFSYSTPVQATIAGTPQVVAVTREEVCGIDKTSGKLLWRYELPEQGLTNVPTPLVVDENHLLVSGQGCQGTRSIEITRENDKFTVSEKWFNRQLPFFYSNWALLSDGQVMGCLENFLVTFDPKDGTLTGRWRGFNDANLLQTGNEFIVLDGKGKINKLVRKPEGFSHELKINVLDARCWTPISAVNGRLFVRGTKTLVCLNVNGDAALNNVLSKPKLLEYRER